MAALVFIDVFCARMIADTARMLADSRTVVLPVYDVVTAAHELAANAVRHGAAHGRLRLWADGRSLRCQVSDDGPEERAANRPDAAAWHREHGHGLWLADQVSLERDPGVTTVTVTFIIGSSS